MPSMPGHFGAPAIGAEGCVNVERRALRRGQAAHAKFLWVPLPFLIIDSVFQALDLWL